MTEDNKADVYDDINVADFLAEITEIEETEAEAIDIEETPRLEEEPEY